MITRVMNKDREAVGIYLRSVLVNSIGICSKINKYGLESDELYVYADFWADGEIKYVFSVADGDVTVFSPSNEVDIMDIYVYLRDHFIGYASVTGEEKKVRDFMRHTLFRTKKELGVFLANTRSFREPEFEENLAVPAHVADAGNMLALCETKAPAIKKHSKESIVKSIKEYGAFLVRDSAGDILAQAIVEEKAGRMVEIGIYTTGAEAKNTYAQMAAGALASAILKKKYACCCRTYVIGEKQVLKSMGFQPVGTDLYLSR